MSIISPVASPSSPTLFVFALTTAMSATVQTNEADDGVLCVDIRININALVFDVTTLQAGLAGANKMLMFNLSRVNIHHVRI